MKKLTKENQSKSSDELTKSVAAQREEIAKLKLQNKVNPAKDTNLLHKKKKLLALLLTLQTQKEELKKITK